MKKRKILQVSIYFTLLSLGFIGYRYLSRFNTNQSADNVSFVDDSPGDFSLATDTDQSSQLQSSIQNSAPAKDSRKKPTSVSTSSNSNSSPVVVSSVVDSSDAPSLIAPTGTVSTPTQNSISQTQQMSPTPTCSFGNSGTPSHQLILNEIAWMGTLPEDGETSAKAGNREWIELSNISSGTVDLSGWQILSASGNLDFSINNSKDPSVNTEISPSGFYLLVRGGGTLPNGIKADFGYSGGLSNSGDELALFDPGCGLADFLDASSGWPGGNNTTKQTLERDTDGFGWHTSTSAGGTPKAVNSIPAPPPSNLVAVSMSGNGAGIISTSPAGILCEPNCEASYPSGTAVIFSALPADGSVFKAWSVGSCVAISSSSCSVVVSNLLNLSGEFDLIPTISGQVGQPSQTDQISSIQNGLSSSTPTQNIPVNANPDHLVISAIQISGSASSNDFVKIFNPTSAAVDISSWKLHKKSSTGADYSLKSFPTGLSLPAGGVFIWANSDAGFADSIGANVSSTETLSADNSVALMDSTGAIVDEVAWGNGTGQYVEGDPYPTDPTSGQVLSRKTSAGAIVDTGDNANDFELQ